MLLCIPVSSSWELMSPSDAFVCQLCHSMQGLWKPHDVEPTGHIHSEVLVRSAVIVTTLQDAHHIPELLE